MLASVYVNDILEHAAARGVSKVRLAEKAGIRPETLSRLRRQEHADIQTLANLAMAVGLRLQLSPIEDARFYSPLENALEKKRERQESDRLLANGLVSAAELQRRSGYFSFPDAQIESKSVEKKRS